MPIVARTMYTFTFYYAVTSVDSTSLASGGCEFNLNDKDTPGSSFGVYSWDFASSPPTMGEYYQGSITFEAPSTTKLQLSAYCHGATLSTPADTSFLLDTFSLKPTDLVCGSRGAATTPTGQMAVAQFDQLDGADRCADFCYQTSGCMTVSYDGVTCTLWDANSFDLQFMYADSATAFYEMGCFECGRTSQGGQAA